MIKFDISKFKHLSTEIDLVAEPIAVFKNLYLEEPFSFIYESLETRGERGRYSFVGGRPFCIISARNRDVRIKFRNSLYREKTNPYELLREIVNCYDSPLNISPFSGGAVGYLSYEMVKFFEDVPCRKPDEVGAPDMVFLFPSELIVFDHKEGSVRCVVYSEVDSDEKLRSLVSRLKRSSCCLDTVEPSMTSVDMACRSNFSKESYCRAVERAKQYIQNGDIFQTVISQRFSLPVSEDPFSIFRAMRVTNPSPYMYFLNLGGFYLLGSSPEVLVKLKGRIASTRPLAGTRPRGRDEKEDRSLANELQSDAKECAEHIMLVDLARNDLGRVCESGTVNVTELLEVEYYSKVMHLVSNVEGRLEADKDGFDLLAAAFPAGTVSGAPKIRAMEIIDELEPERRGIYAGSIGYFSFNGDMDMCIAIRLIIIKSGIAYVQAGAGIVADSNPELEYQETLNKAGALFQALGFGGKR